MKIIGKMYLQSNLDSKADLQLGTVALLQFKKSLAVGRKIQRKLQAVRSPWIIRIQMLCEADPFHFTGNGTFYHFFHRCGGIGRKIRVHMAVP